MRILLIGDIVGKPGRQIVVRAVKGLKLREGIDFVAANAENAAGGSGLTVANYRELIAGGVDCITMGDHIYRRNEIARILNSEPTIIKPANYPAEAAGRNDAHDRPRVVGSLDLLVDLVPARAGEARVDHQLQAVALGGG